MDEDENLKSCPPVNGVEAALELLAIESGPNFSGTIKIVRARIAELEQARDIAMDQVSAMAEQQNSLLKANERLLALLTAVQDDGLNAELDYRTSTKTEKQIREALEGRGQILP